MFPEAVDGLVAHTQRARDGLSGEDLKTLRALLQRLVRNLVDDDTLFEQVLHFGR